MAFVFHPFRPLGKKSRFFAKTFGSKSPMLANKVGHLSASSMAPYATIDRVDCQNLLFM